MTVSTQVACFALTRGPLPPLTRTLEIGDLARRAVLSQFGRAEKRSVPPVLSGHSGEGPLRDNHRHTFYLPTDDNCDGFLDHVVVYSPVGFGPEEQLALERVEAIYGGSGLAGWPVQLLSMSQAAVFQTAGGPWGPATWWESATPYVLTRFPKQYRDGTPKVTERGEQRDGPEDQARREWAQRRQSDPGLPELASVALIPVCRVRGRELPWRQFQLSRRSGRGTSSGFAFGLRLGFVAPVAGPVALGFGCHFGLGQFRPVTES